MSKHINYAPDQETIEYHLILTNTITCIIDNLLKKQLNKVINNRDVKILDVGCGRGELLQSINSKLSTKYNNRVLCYGIDMDEKCVEMSSNYGIVKKCSIEQIDCLKNKFDIIICSHVLEHLENPLNAVDKIKEISNGWFIFAVPNLGIFRTGRGKPKYVNKGHLHGWDSSHFLTFLELGCKLKVFQWGADKVSIPGRRIRYILKKLRLLKFLEEKYLPSKYPFMCKSLIALCTLPGSRLNGTQT